MAGGPLVDEEHSLLLVRVFRPIVLLKRGRREEKAKDMGIPKEKLQKGGCSNPFAKCLQAHRPPRLQDPVISPQVPPNSPTIEVSTSLLTIAPKLFSVFLFHPFFSMSFFLFKLSSG